MLQPRFSVIILMNRVGDVFRQFERCERQEQGLPQQCYSERLSIANCYVVDDPFVKTFCCETCGCKVYCSKLWKSPNPGLLYFLLKDKLPSSCCLNCDMKVLHEMGFKSCSIALAGRFDYFMVYMCGDQ